MKIIIILLLFWVILVPMNFVIADEKAHLVLQIFEKNIEEEDLAQKEISYKELISKTHERIADNYAKQEKWDEAVKEYKIALEYDPDLFTSYFGIGDILVIKEEFEKRSQYFEEAIKYYEKGLEIKEDISIKDRVTEIRKILSQKKMELPFKETDDIILALIPKRYIGVVPSIDLYIQFAFDSDKILPEAEEQLEALGQALISEELKGYRYEISGHTCNIGGDDYNKRLSERRARSVKKYLERRFKISPEGLTIKGYGKNKPIADNSTEVGRQKNRRVQITNLGRIP